jgi:hypothetical protein
MEHLTITPDIRELDCLYLATIGGVDYFETRQIVKMDNGVRSVVGLASAWPLIQRDARIGELTALLVASERRSIEADCHVSELLARLSAYDELFAVTPPAEMADEAPAPPHLRDDGRVPCDYPGCADRVKPRGLSAHKRQAHGVVGLIGHKPTEAADRSPSMDERRKCPHCTARPRQSELASHIVRRHAAQTTVAPTPTPAPEPIAIALGEQPWRCASCGGDAHARSLKVPTLCIRCVVAQTDGMLTNGHLAAA